MISRIVEKNIQDSLFLGKVIILYGARRVGKTTIAKNLLEKYSDRGGYFNCEELGVQEILSENSSSKMLKYFGDKDLLIFDEAQIIPEIGQRLKLLIDTKPSLQIIATGSSSFDLANKIGEPLTGRMLQFTLYPLSVKEISQDSSLVEVYSNLENLLIYGSYPSVWGSSRTLAYQELTYIAGNNLYKDILAFENLKKPSLLQNLIKLLAVNLGKEVSFSWLAQRLNTSIQTVEHYLDLLEKTFIIYTLRTLNKNLNKEISRGFKVYFSDLGVRNYFINNFNTLDIRDDIGGLWENFCFIERKKYLEYNYRYVNTYFWRTYDQKEIDYIEEAGGHYDAFEFKWSDKKNATLPVDFANAYPQNSFSVVNNKSWSEFLL